ncbi:MAG: hypothetical protein DHS80DRAFT_28455 [Piptocephalis tieghemiana]|nr:MAG: hypothetical protein DHS80DRAFT_28455 [Piptocephalis tieghemiana]
MAFSNYPFGTVEIALTSLGLAISGLTLVAIFIFLLISSRKRGSPMRVHRAEWFTALILVLLACGRGIYLVLLTTRTTDDSTLDWSMFAHMLMLACTAHLHLDLGKRYRQYVQSTSSTFRFILLITASMAYFVAIGSRAAGIVGRGRLEMPYTTLRPICWSMEVVALVLGQLYALGLGQRGGRLVGWEKQRSLLLCLAPIILPAADIPSLLPTAGHPESLRYTLLVSISEAFIYLILANRASHPWLGGTGRDKTELGSGHFSSGERGPTGVFYQGVGTFREDHFDQVQKPAPMSMAYAPARMDF